MDFRTHDERLHAELRDAGARLGTDGDDAMILRGEALGVGRADALDALFHRSRHRRRGGEVARNLHDADIAGRHGNEDGVVPVAVAGRIDCLFGHRLAVGLHRDERVEVAGRDIDIHRDAGERERLVEGDDGCALVGRARHLHAVVGGVDRLGGGAREGEDGEVAVETERVGWCGERTDGEPFAAAHDPLGVDDVLHRIFGLHPRPARGAPAAAVGEGQLDAEALGLLVGEVEQVKPRLATERDVAGGDAVGNIEYLRAADAGAGHGLQVGGDAFLRDVAVHPVPPHVRACGSGRHGEPVKQRVAAKGRCREGCGQRGGERRPAKLAKRKVHAHGDMIPQSCRRRQRLPCAACAAERKKTLLSPLEIRSRFAIRSRCRPFPAPPVGKGNFAGWQTNFCRLAKEFLPVGKGSCAGWQTMSRPRPRPFPSPLRSNANRGRMFDRWGE